MVSGGGPLFSRRCSLGELRSSDRSGRCQAWMIMMRLPGRWSCCRKKNQYQSSIVMETREFFICSGFINQVVGERQSWCFRGQRPEVTCCCYIQHQQSIKVRLYYHTISKDIETGMITMMKINENIIWARLSWWQCDWHMIALNSVAEKYSEYLQDHNPNFRQKIIQNILKNNSKQPDRWRHPRQQASCQNGDLAGLDFAVNRTAYSVISRFHGSLESSCG